MATTIADIAKRRKQARQAQDSGRGGLFGIPLPNLGVGNLVSELGAIPGVLTRLGTSLAPGGEAAGDVWSQAGKGLASSVAGTGLRAIDAATLGKAHGITDPLREQWGGILGDERYRPAGITETIDQRGVLPLAFEDIGNIALGSAAAGRLARAGSAGRLAHAGRMAQRARSLGYTPDELARATQVASESGLGRFRSAGVGGDLKRAGQAQARAAGRVADDARVAGRARVQTGLERAAHPYQTAFREVVRPVGRAAQARLIAEAQGPPRHPIAELPRTPEPEAPSGLEGVFAEVAEAGRGELGGRRATSNAQRAQAVERIREMGEDPVVLYRGQRAGDELGDFWTENIAEARTHAGPEGQVYETIAPRSAVDAGRARAREGGNFGASGESAIDLDYEWVDLGRPLDEPGAPTAGARAPEEPLGAPDAVPEDVAPGRGLEDAAEGIPNEDRIGPVQERVRAQEAESVPEWATNLAEKLPENVVRGLARLENWIEARITGRVVREQTRMQEIERRKFLNTPEMQRAARVASQELVGREMPDGTVITPEIADALIGEEVIARLTGVDILEQAAVGGRSDKVVTAFRQALAEAGARGDRRLPDEWIEGELASVLDEMTEFYRQNARERLEVLYESGTEGLEQVGSTTPRMTKGQKRLLQQITNDLREITKLEEKGIPKERARLERTIAHMERTIERLDEEIARAEGDEAAARADLDEARLSQQRVTDVQTPRQRLQRQLPVGEEALTPAQMRAEIQRIESEIATLDKAIEDDIARRAQLPGTETPRVLDQPHERLNTPGERTRRHISNRIADMTNRRAALRDELDALAEQMPEGLTPHERYRLGVEGGSAAERIDQARRKIVETTRRKQKLDEDIGKIKQSMIDGTLKAEQQKARVEGRASRRIEKLAEQMDDPSSARVPAEWQPMWDAVRKLHAEAENNPMLAHALEDVPQSWERMLTIAAENGFDPTHVASFTPSQIRQLVYENVRLGQRGRQLGQTEVAGTRKARKYAQIRTKSLSGLAAGMFQATHEANTNALARFIEDTWARPIDEGGVIPEGWREWDAERSFLLTGDEIPGTGNVQVAQGPGAPTMMIPEAVAKTLRNYQQDFSHSFWNYLRRPTNVWRTFVLTLSPRWYVNNFVGNAMLTAKEGVTLNDWRKAWHQYRQGEGRADSNWLMRRFGAGTESFADPDIAGAIQGRFASETSTVEGLIPYATGREGVRQARQMSGIGEAIQLVGNRIQRANEVVDELSRVAVYNANRRKGMTHKQSIQSTYDALVDYNDLSPFEQRAVRAVVPFYSWQKGILKVAMKYAYENPAAAGILLSLDRINRQIAEDQFGGEVPEYYENVVNLPLLGNVNLRNVNPFEDSDQLLTPQGIGESIGPVADIFLRNALGAPEGGFPEFRRINKFGTLVPDTSPAQDVSEVIAGLPQLRLGQGLTGRQITDIPARLPGRATGEFVGVPRYTDEEVQELIARALRSRDRLT